MNLLSERLVIEFKHSRTNRGRFAYGNNGRDRISCGFQFQALQASPFDGQILC